MDFGKLVEQLTKDWEWLSFLARYCAGKNIGKAFCQDVKWWALGAAALVILIVVWWIWGKLAKAYENWNHRRLMARIADDEAMKNHVWSGHDVHTRTTTK